MEVINPFIQDNKQKIVFFLDELSVRANISYIFISNFLKLIFLNYMH